MKKIEVLGIGCPKCKKTEEMIREAFTKAGKADGTDFEITKVKEPADIAARGVLATPGVIINGKIVHNGGLPKFKAIESWVD